ncbi:MAG: polysulfide reductase NrfD [Anaerolineales bacterium]|nr:MAG: polysulfide reductase NrfD [Anaerolineales bacterium]
MIERLRSSPVYYGWLGVLAVGIAWGLFAVSKTLIEGHGPLSNTTNLTAWGLGIALYVFLVLTTSGLTFVSSLYLVFGIETYRPIAKRAVFLAIVTLLVGLLMIALDLGQPFRAANLVLYQNPSSAMWWMTVVYLVYFVLLVVKFWTLQTGREESTVGQVAGVGALLSAIAAPSTLGAVFGFVIARQGYFGDLMPVYFLLTALFSGFAAIMLSTLVTQALSGEGITSRMRDLMEEVGKHFSVVVGIVALFFVWRMLVGLYPGDDARGFGAFDHLATTFWWQAEVWLALVVPLILLGVPALRRTSWALVLAPLSALVGLFLGRMELVLAGQYEPVLEAKWITELASYAPTFWEWSAVIFAGCLVLVLYTLGERFIGLAAGPPTSAPTTTLE